MGVRMPDAEPGVCLAQRPTHSKTANRWGARGHMKNNLKIAILMTLATTVLLGIIYPLVVTGLAQALFHDKANGQLVYRNGELVGSKIIGHKPWAYQPEAD
jgi:hypothetical protein